jgi:lipid II:glycine glycyltransferase (peptidoglycan interpeptide bridge formation enzyme)
MRIKEINEKEVWEDFLLGCEEKTFLSSWNWGEFNRMMGNKIWRFGIYNDRDPVSVALVVKIIAKRGTFLLIPHGPNIKNPKSEILNSKQIQNSKFKILNILLEKLKEIAGEEKVDFIRVSPIWERNEENNEIFKKLGFKEAPIHMHPEASWKLDLRPAEEELMIQMRKTTRYLIRQAERNKDIEIFQSSKIDDVEIFNKLYQEVVQSQRFIPFSFEYLKNEFLAFQPDNQISLFFGKYKGEIIASAFVLFWSKIGFYHHAALLPQYHKIPIAYSLLWEAIKEAKKRGCILFDFWGYVDPFKNPKHPWAGPTLFKMGFGGKPYEYVKTQDLPLSKKYWLTYIFEKLRKTKRGL